MNDSIPPQSGREPSPGYAEVAVTAPLMHSLTYELTAELAAGLLPGMRLLVPLGRQMVTGYLLGFTDRPPLGCEAKAVSAILDREPLFPASLIPFYRWIAAYYRHPLGEVIKAALPGGMSPASGRRVALTPEGRSRLMVTEADPPWVIRLHSRGELPPPTLRKLWQNARARRQLERWEEGGLITITSELARDAVRVKTEFCLRMVVGHTRAPALLKASELKTLDLLRQLSQQRNTPWVPRRELNRAYSGARKTLPALLGYGFIAGEERPVYRDPFGEPPVHCPEPERLSAEQQLALDEIEPAIERRKFITFLLHGVTGSGKTEVYLRAAGHTLAIGRSVLVLVPEIALATQVEAHFLSRFGNRVAILHSGLTPGEKFDQWQRLARGNAMVVIGARSAVFAPLQDPGLIIVDEEHDSAYKQEDGLRYQARDLAVLRGSLQGAAVLLGSATPAVTSFHHARAGKYRLLTLGSRVENRPLPEVTLVDMREVKSTSGRPPVFSPPLLGALKENLATGDQSLLFLNRRGFASLLLCRPCGQPLRCRQCNVTLTFHKGRGELLCHYCGYRLPSATLCPQCRAGEFLEIGFGTERVETELNRLFPQARIARLDRDTGSDRKSYLAVLRAVRERNIDILIGTQMIAKGLHFPHVTLVGVVWADAGLGLPDYRAGERTFQLLSQVTGRTGRGEKTGRVLVQTCQPDHYAVVTARHHDYLTFFNREISLRQELGFPPFTRLINLRLEGKEEGEVQEAALALAQAARQQPMPGLSVLGPAPAPLSRLRGLYRWQLLLKGSRTDALRQLCSSLLERHPSHRRVKLSVDIDPDSML